MAGLPPLSGFIGKLLILDAARGGAQAWIWSVILVSTLAVIIAFSRAGSLLFWKSEAVAAAAPAAEPVAPPPALRRTVLPLVALLAVPAGLTLFAGPAADFFDAAAAQIGDVSGYVAGVLGPDAGAALRR